MSIASAVEVLLEVNVSCPLERRERTFLKALKWWLIKRETPIEKGDALTIPSNILLEANTATYYSWETPTAKVLSTNPEGTVLVTANTNLKVDFRPSGPS
jgi:hypothetical protein